VQYRKSSQIYRLERVAGCLLSPKLGLSPGPASRTGQGSLLLKRAESIPITLTPTRGARGAFPEELCPVSLPILQLLGPAGDWIPGIRDYPKDADPR
jgi:hypothetical protein